MGFATIHNTRPPDSTNNLLQVFLRQFNHLSRQVWYSDAVDGIVRLGHQVFIAHESYLPYGFGSMMAQFSFTKETQPYPATHTPSLCTLRQMTFLTSNPKIKIVFQLAR